MRLLTIVPIRKITTASTRGARPNRYRANSGGLCTTERSFIPIPADGRFRGNTDQSPERASGATSRGTQTRRRKDRGNALLIVFKDDWLIRNQPDRNEPPFL